MKNIIKTQGFINDNGDISVPGVYFEDGARVDLTITVKPGRFEVAMLPSEEKTEDCGISEEEIMRCCAQHEDCDDCPLNDYCEEEFDYE